MAVNRRSAGMGCRNGFLTLHGVALMDIALLMILSLLQIFRNVVVYGVFGIGILLLTGIALFAIWRGIGWLVSEPGDGDFCARHRP